MPGVTGEINIRTSIGQRTNTKWTGTTTARANKTLCRESGRREWVAGIDGSVDRKTETIGAGLVMGTALDPEDNLSFSVGGPLASLRGEAAGLDCPLDQINPDKQLLVFTDCLLLLTILLLWSVTDRLLA